MGRRPLRRVLMWRQMLFDLEVHNRKVAINGWTVADFLLLVTPIADYVTKVVRVTQVKETIVRKHDPMTSRAPV